MKNKSNASRVLHLSVACALLSAISIFAGKYLAINAGEVLRFSFENLPILFAGMAFGPIGGALVGAVADLVGCMLVGYAINPIITLGAVAIGVIAGIYRYLPLRVGVWRVITIALIVLISHAVGSVIIKTFGLSVFYDMHFGILMLWRALNYLIVGSIECLFLLLLFKNKSLCSQINKILPRRSAREVK